MDPKNASPKHISPPARHRAEEATSSAVTDYVGRIARQRIYHGADIERVSVPFSEFQQLARRVRPSVLLPALAALTLANVTGTPGQRLNLTAPPWAVAVAARENILRGNEYRSDKIDGDYLRRLFNAHNDIADPDTASDDDIDVLALLTRIVYDQFPYNESIFEELSRTHALMVEGANNLDLEVLNDDNTWERLVGAPLGQAVGATFFLQVGANVNAGWYDTTWLDRPDVQNIYDKWPRAVIEQRAAALTSTVAEFKTAYEQAPKPPAGHERYAYNPLVARPFIHMPDGRALAPQPRLILRTITPGGLYYRGMNEYGSPFARDLGKLTERYVGELLANLDPESELHPEIRYGKGNGQASTDWFLVLPSVVVMFEVKSARYGLLDRAAVPGYENSVIGLLNKAINQLAKTNEHLDNHHDRFKHIPNDRPRVGIIVTGEPYYLANSTWMRDRVAPSPIPTIVASLRDIEHLAGLPLHQVEAQLVAIANDPERSTWNLSTALKDNPEQGRSPVLQRAWDNYPWLEEEPDTTST